MAGSWKGSNTGRASRYLEGGVRGSDFTQSGVGWGVTKPGAFDSGAEALAVEKCHKRVSPSSRETFELGLTGLLTSGEGSPCLNWML